MIGSNHLPFPTSTRSTDYVRASVTLCLCLWLDPSHPFRPPTSRLPPPASPTLHLSTHRLHPFRLLQYCMVLTTWPANLGNLVTATFGSKLHWYLYLLITTHMPC